MLLGLIDRTCLWVPRCNNELPLELRKIENCNEFGKQLKEYFNFFNFII